MIRPTVFLGLIILALVAFVLYEVEYKVDSLKTELNELNKQLAEDKEAIHVLKAEWSYLNRPEKIKNMSERYLSLKNTEPAQVKKIEDIPFSTPKVVSNNTTITNVTQK